MRALVVGAGIGGDALAVLLERRGWDVEVVEIAPALRSGGQTVDLRGTAGAVLAELGVLAACRARLIPQKGIAWVTAAGRPMARMGVEAFGGRGFVSTEELLRTDLAAEIHAAGGPAIAHRFGDTVQHLEQRDGRVRVAFRSGDEDVFDVVVGADGTRSRVRAALFGDEPRFRRRLGVSIAWFTLREQAGTPDLDGWFQVHNAPGSLVVSARPGRAGEQEVGLTFPDDDLPDRRDRAAQLDLLDRRFAGVGWRTPELLAAARVADDFALDTCDQIRLETWSAGSVVLLGDSAWCASPLSGMGTALALQGASTLAAELAGAVDADGIRAAAARFETAMRPRVVAAQRLPPGRVRLHAPRTSLGIRAAAATIRAVQARPVARILETVAPAA